MRFLSPTILWSVMVPHGRWWLKTIDQQPVLYTTNLGSVLRLTITNSDSITIHVLDRHSELSPSPVFAWRLNQQQWHRVSAGHLEWTIKCNPTTKQELEVITAGNTDLDRVWTGNEGLGITGIEIADDGTVTMPPARPVIDFIGDSITAGCWVNGRHAALDYRPETNYVGIACDDLNVTGVRIAYSAGGVLRPATGGVPNARQYLQNLDATTPWQANQPQLVVINLGVNDRCYERAQFIPAYAELLTMTTEMFPLAPIVVMIPFSQSWAPEIRQLTHEAQLPVIETAGWCQSYTDGLHPDQAASIRCGHLLAQSLRPFLK